MTATTDSLMKYNNYTYDRKHLNSPIHKDDNAKIIVSSTWQYVTAEHSLLNN